MNSDPRRVPGAGRPGTARRIGVAATAAVLTSLAGVGVVAAPPAALAAASPAARPATPAAAGVSGPAAGPAVRVGLPSPVPAWAASLTDRGPAGPAVTMSVRVYLAGRAPAAQAAFTAAASTPGRQQYGRYLTPAQFQSRFGTTESQNAAVQAWAKSAGLTVTGTTSHYVAVTGPAPTFGRALDTSIRAYGSTSFTSGYAPAGGVSVPASLGRDVTTVTGLDELINSAAAAAGSTKQAHSAAGGLTCSAWWGQHVSAIPKADGRTSAPDGVCGYIPQQLRSAYGVRPGSGQGATIAIVLDGSLATMRADANRFFTAHQLPGFSPGQFTVNTGPGFAASCGGSSDVPEEPLDVETAHIIAPAAKIVYVAADCTPDSNQTGLLDAETRVVDQHLADVSTESYSIVENQFTPADAAAWTQVLAQGAAEGIGFDFDSGDGGDLTGAGPSGGTAVTFPASDPWATAVGGTTLEIGSSGTVASELGWGDTADQENTAGSGYTQPLPGGFEEGSTGGRSTLFPEPAYQHGVVPAALSTSGGSRPADREVPDIAADASPATGWLIGYTTPGGRYGQVLEGGTSGSSPIVAALEADAKQGAGHALGFANPLLYGLRHSAGIRDIVRSPSPALALEPNCFADPTLPGPSCLFTLGLDGSLTEARGYDDVTGIGAPTSQFIATLSSAAAGA